MQDIVITYNQLDAFRGWLHDQVSEKALKIDIGCGKDEFIIQAANSEQDSIFLGIENNGHMIWRLEKKVRRSGAANIKLLPFHAAFVLERFLLVKIVTAFYIQFPDPWPKRRHYGRRVVRREFIDWMCQCLVPGGEIFYASDVFEAAENAKMLFENTTSLVNAVGPGFWMPDRSNPWRTLYEKKFIREGKKIYYLRYINSQRTTLKIRADDGEQRDNVTLLDREAFY